MKKYYFIFLVAIFFSGIAMAQEPQKKFINYQGVARNGADQLMANESMTVGITLKVGSSSVAAAYTENHSVMTDANGVFSLKIGNGEAVSGDYYSIPWGSGATFVTVSVNGSEIGTTEMMAVPYALSSGDGSQSANEVPYDNAVSGLAATNAQDAIDELVGSGEVDTDADPTNELQTLRFDVGTNELSLSNGNTVTIPSGGTDADADPTNELQTISFDAASNQISLTDGGTITIPSGGTDADADPTNELQDISLSGTDLNITDGSTIDLSTIIPPGGTDDQNAAEVPFDNSASGLAASNAQAAIDELASSGVVDTDNQNLTFDATTNILEIEDGNTVDLSSLSGGEGSLWSQDGDDVYYDTGKVGIGIIPNGLHQIHDPLESFTQYTVDAYGSGSGDGLVIGLTDGGLFGPVAQITNREEGPFIIGNGGRSNLILDRLGNIETAQDLHVGGAISSASLNGVGTRNVMADADGNLVIGAGGGGSSPWGESAGNIHYNTGNVGMGTDTPSARNHIKHNSSTASPQLLLEEVGSDFARLAFKNESSTAFWNIAGFSRNGASNGTNDSRLSFYFANDAETGNKMSILGNGNVGINTTSPNSKLDVAGDINTSGEVHRTATGNANLLPIAYGTIEGDGRILNSSGNLSVIKRASGFYAITLNDDFLNPNEHTVITSPCSLMLNDMRSYFSADDNGRYIIATYGVSGLEDYRFSVMIFKP